MIDGTGSAVGNLQHYDFASTDDRGVDVIENHLGQFALVFYTSSLNLPNMIPGSAAVTLMVIDASLIPVWSKHYWDNDCIENYGISISQHPGSNDYRIGTFQNTSPLFIHCGFLSVTSIGAINYYYQHDILLRRETSHMYTKGSGHYMLSHSDNGFTLMSLVPSSSTPPTSCFSPKQTESHSAAVATISVSHSKVGDGRTGSWTPSVVLINGGYYYCQNPYSPTATPNGSFKKAVSLDEVADDSQYGVYPSFITNKAQRITVNLKLETSQKLTFTIHNELGQLIYEQKWNGSNGENTFSIPAVEFEAGINFLQIRTSEGLSHLTQRIVKS